jgi:short-subunit dehydrogenase
MATRLAEAGANLILSGRSRDALTELADSLPGEGHEVQEADFAAIGAASELANRAGHVDILVNNAALPGTGRLTDLSEEHLSRALQVNLETPIQLTRALLPAMLERDEGKIVLIGSLAGKAASPYSSIYNATKFGIRGFAFGIRADLEGTGVGITVVAPGFVGGAGMMVDAGVDAPPGLGATTPDKVAKGVLEAIRGNKGEIAVAPLATRVGSHIGLISPSLSHRVQSGKAGQKAAGDLAKGQANKR